MYTNLYVYRYTYIYIYIYVCIFVLHIGNRLLPAASCIAYGVLPTAYCLLPLSDLSNGPLAPPWGLGPSTEAPEGEGGGGHKLGWGHSKIPDKALTASYKTKSRHTTQKYQHIQQSPNYLVLEEAPKY